ncbi:MAG: hypothetical protein ACKVGT_06125 [Flavobacteriales bacterium]|jgi:hypothetical protein|tara:strand:+ start:3292 stop:3714 length:423 start_codon:yes stop_codon:yes gene_type:complete
MKYNILLLAIFFVFNSCGKKDATIQKDKLGGYWGIESVQLPNGSIKDFSINAVVDFVEISEEKGVRTKVAPQFDGSFVNNGTAEKFQLIVENDSLNLYYTTPFDSWKETVLVATDSVLKILNRDSKIYTYKKFRKFNFGN